MAYNQVQQSNVDIKHLPSVNYAINITAVELQQPNNLMSNMIVDPQSYDFEWSALNNPSEINHSPDFWEIASCCMLLLVPCGIYEYCQRMQKSQTQKVKINGKHLYYEHINPACCCFCCFLDPIKYQIRLEDIRLISFSVWYKKIVISYFKEDNPSIYPSTVEIKDFVRTSLTPQLIMNTIETNRPKKLQTKRYTIPYMTQSYKDTTITLNPTTSTIHCTDHFERKTSIAFVDGLGSIHEINEGNIFNNKIINELYFWSPPINRDRSGSNDNPEMIAQFPDDNNVSRMEFMDAAIASRDSFK